MNPKLIYDVGMHNGDDTAYYLWRGFRVVAVEPNPALVGTATERFRREIEAGQLTILNVGVAAEEGELPFWVCLTDDRLSALVSAEASRSDAVREIRVPCRKFRSILDGHGMPCYMKIDIQGNDRKPRDIAGTQRLDAQALSDAPLVALLRRRGFSQFKCISQSHFLPLQVPPVAEARLAQRAERLIRTRNILVRVFRRLGGRR